MANDGVQLTESFANALGGLLVRDAQQRGKGKTLTGKSESRNPPIADGILIEDVTTAYQSYEVLPFQRADRLVVQIALLGEVASGSFTVNGEVIQYNATAAQMAAHFNTILGVTTCVAYSWPGVWIVEVPPEDHSGSVTFSVVSALFNADADVIVDAVPWMLGDVPREAYPMTVVHRDGIKAGRHVMLFQVGDFLKFAIVDNCPEYKAV